MHEFSTAQGIIDTILKVAREHGAKRITEVNLEIGALTMLNPEQLEFSFQALSEGTIANGAKLKISYTPVRIFCRSCRFKGEISAARNEDPLNVIAILKCPRCKSADTELNEGVSCNIKQIRVEKDSAAG